MKLVDGGSVINGPTPFSFLIYRILLESISGSVINGATPSSFLIYRFSLESISQGTGEATSNRIGSGWI